MAHYDRVGIQAERVEKGVDYGIYHSIYRIQGEPLVSVIIPNKDHRQDLDLCIRSIMEKLPTGIWSLWWWRTTARIRRLSPTMRSFRRNFQTSG